MVIFKLKSLRKTMKKQPPYMDVGSTVFSLCLWVSQMYKLYKLVLRKFFFFM